MYCNPFQIDSFYLYIYKIVQPWTAKQVIEVVTLHTFVLYSMLLIVIPMNGMFVIQSQFFVYFVSPMAALFLNSRLVWWQARPMQAPHWGSWDPYAGSTLGQHTPVQCRPNRRTVACDQTFQLQSRSLGHQHKVFGELASVMMVVRAVVCSLVEVCPTLGWIGWGPREALSTGRMKS